MPIDIDFLKWFIYFLCRISWYSGLWSGAKDGIGGAGDGRQFWYTEYNYVSSISPVLNGGVAACSSQDLISWRFEGIVLHYTNLSDLVFGTGEE